VMERLKEWCKLIMRKQESWFNPMRNILIGILNSVVQ
jgi:hypothetical protein